MPQIERRSYKAVLTDRQIPKQKSRSFSAAVANSRSTRKYFTVKCIMKKLICCLPQLNVYIESHPLPLQCCLGKKPFQRHEINIVWKRRGRIVELRGEIGLKYSKMAVSQHFHFCHPLQLVRLFQWREQLLIAMPLPHCMWFL